jgi:hypothetical protein
MKKYFYGENIEVTDNAECIKVSSVVDTSYTFVTPAIAHRFETKFAITDGRFDCLQLVFEDSIDPNIRFTVEIDNSYSETENAPLRINGVALRYRPWAGFDGLRDFYFVYDELNKIIQDDASLKNAIFNADGSVFEGFPSGLVYVTMNVIGVDGGAEIAWKNYGGQILSESDYDTIAPSIKLSNDYASKYAINTVAEIYSAVAADVLSPEVYTKMTVIDPNGKVINDVNGLRLENVPFDRSYFINLEMYGSYSVKYSAMDWMEREQDYPFALLVVDDKAPEITVNGSISYIRHLINIAKLFENAPTYFRCIDLGHKGVSEVNLYLGGNALHILDSYHRTLVASLVKPCKYLVSVKYLSRAVFFDND